MLMPVPGENAVHNSPSKPQQVPQQKQINTPTKPNQSQQSMNKAITPQKSQQPQQQQTVNKNMANAGVKQQPSTPVVQGNKQPIQNDSKKANNLNSNNANGQNKGNNQNQKNGNNMNQKNGNNNNQGNNNNNNTNTNNNNNNNKGKVDKGRFNPNNQAQNNNNTGNNNNNNNNQKAPFDKNKFNANKGDNSQFNNKHNSGNKFNQNGHQNNQGNNYHHSQVIDSTPQAEKKFTGRCRLFCGNLPNEITEAEFKELFKKFGETGECFVNTQRNFGFIKLDTRINAEHAKQELDGTQFKGRTIRVRFATHGAAVKVKNLSPYISNEYLEQAFSMFGPVERAVVVVDDKGRPTGEGIVEFERKPASIQCINKCQENCFILTSYPKPIVVEPLEQKDEEDGLPEKSIIKNAQFYMEREASAHFAANNSNEHKLAMKWREFYDLEKQIQEEGKRRIEQAREVLEFEIEQALIDNKTMQLKEDLRMKQEELQRIEDMRKGEFNRRQELEMSHGFGRQPRGMNPYSKRVMDEQQRQEQMMMMRNNNNPDIGMNQRGGLANQQQMQNQQLGNNINLRQGNGRGGNNNGNQNNNPNFNNNMNPNNQQQFPMDNTDLNSLPPAQQQAIIAAQLSFAMAAAAQQGNMGMFDGQQMSNEGPNSFNMNNNNHNQGGRNNDRNNNDKGNHRVDNRGNNNSGGNNNPNRNRQFDRRGGKSHHSGNRDESYPGYDTKRSRY